MDKSFIFLWEFLYFFHNQIYTHKKTVEKPHFLSVEEAVVVSNCYVSQLYELHDVIIAYIKDHISIFLDKLLIKISHSIYNSAMCSLSGTYLPLFNGFHAY